MPQQNGFIERKKKIVTEMDRTMLKDSKLSNVFWIQAVWTIIHILNRGMIISKNGKNTYELWKGIPTNIKHFKLFGIKCYIKREDIRIGKFDFQIGKGILVGYSRKRKGYKCYNLRINKIVERKNVKIDEKYVLNIKEERNNTKEHEVKEETKEQELE
jgi:hypothetical protein